ncbi:hypothetical protein LCGC14_0397230 [marine sediment metagenome]|uniref:Uncharacterized protein n=1 Tax=marine sediment metagenome TaxID=412755 RepID=A0A0F9SY05_9ZZZZ
MIAAVIFAAALVQKLVEHAKEAFDLKGYAVAALALAAGAGVSYGFGLEMYGVLLSDYGVNPEPWVDKLYTAATIGFGAGLVNDIAGR